MSECALRPRVRRLVGSPASRRDPNGGNRAQRVAERMIYDDLLIHHDNDPILRDIHTDTSTFVCVCSCDMMGWIYIDGGRIE
jgi:hypothetical protein